MNKRQIKKAFKLYTGINPNRYREREEARQKKAKVICKQKYGFDYNNTVENVMHNVTHEAIKYYGRRGSSRRQLGKYYCINIPKIPKLAHGAYVGANNPVLVMEV